MSFSSISFLYFFLPLVGILYHVIPAFGKHRLFCKNLFLLLASLVFYILGSPIGLPYLFIVLFTGYAGGLLFEYLSDKRGIWKRVLFVFSILICVSLLFFFKYYEPDSLPVGISFYTFQAIAYLADIYRGKCPAQKNPVTFCTFITFFPQLIAGPIVRYQDISLELNDRAVSLSEAADGLKRFLFGLFKKILVADQLAAIIAFWGTPSTVTLYWMVAIAYTLQIYYDFSAYSDMAIGMGRFFGFHLPENFNYPYISASITEFWRRWHMTLGSWFRDYVYIPLGGNRKYHVRNLLIVFALTGLWHGIGWQFFLWGLFYGILIVVEKLGLLKLLERLPKFISHVYTMLMVILGFVIFSAKSMPDALNSFAGMFGGLGLPVWNQDTAFFLKDFAVPFLMFVAFCLPILPAIQKFMDATPTGRMVAKYASLLFYPFLLLLCSAWIIVETPQPFLYFQF